MFFSSVKEMNRLISKGMLNIYYWQKPTSQNFDFLRKKMHWKETTSFEEQKDKRLIQGNIYFGIIVFGRLSFKKPCLRFPSICFVQEIKGFYWFHWQNESEHFKKFRHAFVNWLFNDIRRCLVIGCFDWKIGVFQQTVVRV